MVSSKNSFSLSLSPIEEIFQIIRSDGSHAVYLIMFIYLELDSAATLPRYWLNYFIFKRLSFTYVILNTEIR